ncbi:hypothetical protein AGLY_013861 [Aphis glycines]|uniref:Uncharacterized protein n=1 Tax=Aphis glycines TaxID=307491 RepID=A0A6G0T5M8_APHGL|nr:hypothetical protein AGLY_013861 [Aphis glycines]
MDSTSSNDIESDLYHPDVSPVLSTVETSTFDIETPSTGKKNVEVAVPVVYPGEEPTLKPVHSTELMTEAISFVETDTNAPVDTPTFDIETPCSTGKKNVEVAVPVVYPGEEPTLKPAHSTELMTEAISFVETDTNAPVDTPTCEIEIPGPETDNIEVARPVVCPAEEETLSPAHSTELMTTEVISFVEADTNAPVETSTCVIETLGPNMENIEIAAPPAVVSLTEVQTLSQTSIIDTDKTAPLQKKKNRFLSALRRGLRRVFKTICGCGCSFKENLTLTLIHRDCYRSNSAKYGGGTDVRYTVRRGLRCDRLRDVLATGRSVSGLIGVRHRRPAVRTRPAGHLGENDISDTRTSAVVRPEFLPRNPVGRARAAGRHPFLPVHTFATALAIIFFFHNISFLNS